MDLVGIGWNSVEEKKLRNHQYNRSEALLEEATKYSGDEASEMFFLTLKAMYDYGMVVEMPRLGMR